MSVITTFSLVLANNIFISFSFMKVTKQFSLVYKFLSGMFKGRYWLLALDCNPDKKIFVKKINRWYQLGIRETLFEKKVYLKKNSLRFKTLSSTTNFRRKL